jgi:hypothetical protein
VIFPDLQRKALSQLDLAVGFSDDFVVSLENLYREFSALLERLRGDGPGRAAPVQGKSAPQRCR